MKKPSKLTTMIVLCVILSFILFPGLLYVCIIVGTWKAVSHSSNT